jgi:drug/metabolite transporter (DMT)-like permease
MPGISVYLALTGTTVFWGFSFIGTKLALQSFSPFTLMFLRFSLASVFFLVIFLYKGFPRFTRKQHLKLFLLSFFEPGLYFTFETYGLRLTTASKAALIIALVPVAVAVLSRIALKEKLSARSIAGIVLSIFGIAVLVFGGREDILGSDSSILGDLLIFGAVVSVAFYMILVRDLGKEASSFGITGYQIFYGAFFFAPFFLLNPRPVGPVLPGSVGAVLFLASFATIGGFLCYNYALSKVSASRAAIFINGIPVVTAAGAWVILGERLGPVQFLGAAVVILAVTLTNTASRKIAEESEPNLVG